MLAMIAVLRGNKLSHNTGLADCLQLLLLRGAAEEIGGVSANHALYYGGWVHVFYYNEAGI